MTSPVRGPGATYDRGRYVTDAWLRGHADRGVYTGHRGDDGQLVLITVRLEIWEPPLIDGLKFDVPGVAPMLYFGPPDGYRDSRVHRSTLRAVIESRPAGVPVSDLAGTLSLRDLVRLGLGMLDVLDSAATRGIDIQGIRPETVYVVQEPDGLVVSGIAPRAVRALHYLDEPPFTLFDGHSYEAPELYATLEPSATSDLFSAALVLWFAHTRAHAYRVSPNEIDGEVMRADDRGAFPGPPELGAILEPILVADPARRPTLPQVRAQLAALARGSNRVGP